MLMECSDLNSSPIHCQLDASDCHSWLFSSLFQENLIPIRGLFCNLLGKKTASPLVVVLLQKTEIIGYPIN